VLAAKTLMLAAAVATGVLAAAFGGCTALQSAGAPAPVPNATLAPTPGGFGTLHRSASVVIPMPAMPVAPQS
jgi:hypothetical protein